MKVSNHSIVLSKELRRTKNPWEVKLWYYLRAHRMNGLKFKRQVPIGKYIVDFCCDEIKLIIELDGGQHSEAQLQDAQRDSFLKSQGYTVLRFWNNDFDSNLEGVLEAIRDAATSPGLRPPSPRLGRENQ